MVEGAVGRRNERAMVNTQLPAGGPGAATKGILTPGKSAAQDDMWNCETDPMSPARYCQTNRILAKVKRTAAAVFL